MRRLHLHSLSVFLIVVSVIGCSNNAAMSEQEVEKRKAVAGELRNSKLYAAAIEEYRTILDLGQVSDDERANLNYLIARIYFEDMKDYQAAAAHYIKAREYNPDASFMTEASKNLVASLQKIGKVAEARVQLSQAADLDAPRKDTGDVIVAKIAEEPVYKYEVERRINNLPPEIQQELTSPSAKADFARQYVGTELLYRAAVRENYPEDPEIVRRAEDLARQLVIEKYVIDKVMPNTQIDTLDLKNFYSAHKEDRYGGQPFDSVQAQVFMDYQQQKAEAAYSDYIRELAEAENVQFFDNAWK